MAVLQMQRFSICAMTKDRKAILEELQRAGVLEINTSGIEDGQNLVKKDTMESRQQFEKNATIADNALDVLKEYAPEKTSLFDSLAGKELIDSETCEKAAQNKDGIIRTANDILQLDKQISEDKAGIVKLQTQIESLVPWMSLDVPMNYKGTKTMEVLIGSIGNVVTQDAIYEGIAAHAPELEAFDIQIISAEKDQTCLAASCLKKDAAKLEEALRSMGFARPAQIIGKVPTEQKKEYEEQIKELEKEISSKEVRLKDYAVSRPDLKMVSDYFRMRAQKYEVLGQVLHSRQTFVVSGYVPAVEAKKLESRLVGKYDIAVDIDEVTDEEDVPVLLKNNKVAASAEGVLASFGLPKKGELDPTTIMSAFYIFLFGLMLSDAAYGLIVFAACAIALKKFPRMSEGMAKSVRLFMYCGISTLFWGIMFGGYFGDAIQVVARTFFGKEIPVFPLWFEPIKDPMKLLIFSMLFGLIHLFTGLAIKGYICLKEGRVLDFFCDVVLWFMFLIGLILILLPSQIFASIAQMNIVFPPVVNTLAKVLAIAGAVGLLFMSGRSSKNFGLRIALGAYDLYNITGWLSDVLSYSRLLALGLATGVIASVVNQMGSMAGSGVFGAIVFVVVFIVGHTLNLAINLLGAYVHTNRLQYVEFFGKFYEGGGRPFNPFKPETKYVDIKEES